MEKSWLAFVNAVLKDLDPSWQPTDNIPAVIVEAFKDLLPWILPLIKGVQANVAAQTKSL